MFKIVKSKKYQKSLNGIEKIVVLENLQKAISRIEKWPVYETNWNVHWLYGEYDNYQSINVTWDWRLVFKRDIVKSEITLYDVWTHAQLY